MINNEVYQDLVKEIKSSYPNISSSEIERIVDSQFRVIRDTMSNREGKVIQLIYLGKFRPTAYNIDYNKNERNNNKCK